MLSIFCVRHTVYTEEHSGKGIRSGIKHRHCFPPCDGEYNISSTLLLDSLPSSFDDDCRLSQSHLRAFPLKVIRHQACRPLMLIECQELFIDITIQTFVQHLAVSCKSNDSDDHHQCGYHLLSIIPLTIRRTFRWINTGNNRRSSWSFMWQLIVQI